MTSFVEWLEKLRDIDLDRYEWICDHLRQEAQAKSMLDNPQCGHEQMTGFVCELCGMDFS